MNIIHFLLLLISICLGLFYYYKGEVETTSYLACIISGFFMPKTFPNINDQDNVLKWRQFIEYSSMMDIKPEIKYQDIYIASKYIHHDRKILLRIYNGNEEESQSELKKVLIFYFPGAWILGSVEHVDATCRQLASYTNFIVVSVEYSLAPEFPFPNGFHDAYNAFKWVYKHIQSYGGDLNEIYLSGESAGGNLAAAVTARNADIHYVSIEDRIPIKGLMLIYPPLACQFNTSSYMIYSTFNPMLPASQMEHACNMYKGDQYISDLDYTYQPLVAPSHVLQEFPSTIFIVAKYDVLRDDSLIFANLLTEVHVEVEVMLYNSTIHGFFGRSFSPLGLIALEEASNKLLTLGKS